MSFLFGKKKPLPHAAASGPHVPAVSAAREKAKSPHTAPITTPDSSINNSLNSLGGGATPSPEHGGAPRGGPEQDSQVSGIN